MIERVKCLVCGDEREMRRVKTMTTFACSKCRMTRPCTVIAKLDRFTKPEVIGCASCSRLRAELDEARAWIEARSKDAIENNKENSRLNAELETTKTTLEVANLALEDKTEMIDALTDQSFSERARVEELAKELETTKTKLNAVKLCAFEVEHELIAERARRDEFRKWLEEKDIETCKKGMTTTNPEFGKPYLAGKSIGLNETLRELDRVFGRAGETE